MDRAAKYACFVGYERTISDTVSLRKRKANLILSAVSIEISDQIIQYFGILVNSWKIFLG